MSSNSNPTRRALPLQRLLLPSLPIAGVWLATLATLSPGCKSDAGNPGNATDHGGSGASAGAGSELIGDGGASSAGSNGEISGISGASAAGARAVAGSGGAAGGADLGEAGASGALDGGGTNAGGTGGAAAGGNAGVGGASGGAGGSAGPTAVGSAALIVPFVKSAGATSTTFQIAFDRDVDLSAAVATFDLCVESSSEPKATIAFGAHNGLANDFNAHMGTPMLLSDLTTCPTMKRISFNVPGDTLVANAVEGVDVVIAAPAISETSPTPTVVFLDSVKFSNNAAGPYDFTYNSQPILLSGYIPHVAHSGVGFAAVGSDSPVVSPGVAKLSVPFTASGQATTYSYLPAGAVDLSGVGLTLNANLCVASSTASPSSYGYRVGLNSNSSAGAGDHSTSTISLATLSTCPTMTKTSLPIAGGTLYSPLVTNFYIQLESLGNGPFGSASIEVDSITVTPNNPVGPYDFSFNTETLQTIGTSQPGSTVTWLPLP